MQYAVSSKNVHQFNKYSWGIQLMLSKYSYYYLLFYKHLNTNLGP